MTRRLWFVGVATVLVVGAIVVRAERGGEVDDGSIQAGAAPTVDAGDPDSDPEPAEEVVAEAATPSPAATATPELEPRRISVAFTGEILSHGSLIEQARRDGGEDLAYDYRPMFEQVAPILREADLAICHQETPLSTDNTALSGYPIFNSPRELADAIAWAGWDACSTAHNHALDRGFAGVASTLDQLDRVGVGHAGTARTAEEAATPSLYEVGDLTVGHLSWTYGLNGFPLPADAPFAVDVIDAESILAEAARARDGGADIVVMSVQWGTEYQAQPTPQQTALAEQILASPDVDLIVGAHVHVPQPMDLIDGEYVLYGLGNFVSNQSPQTCGSCPAASEDGMILWVEMIETADGGFEVDRIEVIPTWVDRRTYTVIPVSEALADPDADPQLVPQLEASWSRTVGTVQSLDVALPRVEFSPFPAGTAASPAEAASSE